MALSRSLVVLVGAVLFSAGVAVGVFVPSGPPQTPRHAERTRNTTVVRVPNVVGEVMPVASQRLQSDDLAVAVRTQGTSSGRPTVVVETPPPGKVVARGTEVTLVVQT